MHQAPPVEYPLGNFRVLNRFAGAAWLIVVLIDLLCLYLADFQGSGPWICLALTMVLGAIALQLCPVAGSGVLHWDGTGWSRHDGLRDVGGNVTVHLDLQSALLVTWTPVSGRVAWCWLDSGADAACWLALRRALLSPQRTGPVAAPGSGSAMQA